MVPFWTFTRYAPTTALCIQKIRGDAMETWIKSKADQLAQAAHQQVNAVHQSASKLAGDVLQKVTVGQEDDYRKDLEFRDGPLGFTLEGSLVVDVQSNSQAERLGVCIGDRLVRVDGYEVPDVESGGFEEQRARALIAKWLKDMPRPGVLTFELPEIYSDEEAEPEAGEAGGSPPASGSPPGSPPVEDQGQAAKSSTAVQVLQGELQRIQEERRKLSMELQETQEQRGALSAQVDQLQQRSDQQMRRIGDLEEQLQTLRNQHKDLDDLHQALSSKDVASQLAAQASLAREEALQRALEAAESRALAAEQELSAQRQELKTALAKLTESEAATAELRMQLEPLEKEMSGFNVAHEAELELLRKEHQRQEETHAQQVKDLEERLDAQKQQAHEELEKQQEELQRLREALVEAQVTAEAAALEARSARMEAASGSGEAVVEQLLQVEESATPVARVPSGSSSEVLGLQKRIDLLENRCASLQRRLSSQESVMSTTPLRPTWELKLAAATGPHVAAVVVTMHRLALGVLRGFLEKLLRSEAWLWVFYAHLLVLYTIAASSSIQTSADAGRGAVESLNAQLASAGAGGAPALRGG